jgi:hypothetical protein
MSRTPTRSSLLKPSRRFGPHKVKRINGRRLSLSLRRTTALVLLVSLISPGLALARQPGSIPGGSAFEPGLTPSLFTSFSQALRPLFDSSPGQNIPR